MSSTHGPSPLDSVRRCQWGYQGSPQPNTCIYYVVPTGTEWSQIGVRPGADDAGRAGGLVLAREQVVGAFQRNETAGVARGPEDLAGVGDADGVVGGRMHDQQRTTQGADLFAEICVADIFDEMTLESERLAADRERCLA